MATPTPFCSPSSTLSTAASLIEDDRFPIDFVSELAEIESWRKEIYRPIYHIHKWWAKRLGSVFRAIILGSKLPKDQSLEDAFYRMHRFEDLVVFDPFMGSGTTIGEAHKLGCIALGRDINQVAFESVRTALGRLDRDALSQAFSALSQSVGTKIRKLYLTKVREDDVCDTLYYFWVKTVPCPFCSDKVDLFSSYIFARNAYPDRKPDTRVYCPSCSNVFLGNVNDIETKCDRCEHRFDPRNGPAVGTSATCQSCRRSFLIAKAVQAQGGPPSHRLYAKLVLTSGDDKIYLPTTVEDEEAYKKCSEELTATELLLPTLSLAVGYNTRQAMNYGYRTWREFFNDRQLLTLGLLRKAICELRDDSVRQSMLTIFSGALEFNNMFTSYKGEGTGAMRHMFSHHILKPERMPIEGNVWGTPRSSGSFSTLFKSRMLRAIDYRMAPFEIGVRRFGSTRNRKIFGTSPTFTGCVDTRWPPPQPLSSRGIYLSCGSSDDTGLPDASVDLVVTDPPFFDNVHYSELADFFYAWQQLAPFPFSDAKTTRDSREVQDKSVTNFSKKLKAVFVECHRVLKDTGSLVFTYHHSRLEGWSALVEAVLGAGFEFVNAHPVKSEMSVATPKSQAKQPIQLDVIMVCRKHLVGDRNPFDLAVAFERASERAKRKTIKLMSKGLRLSLNDGMVILIGMFLVEASAGRNSRQLTDAFRSKAEAFGSAASRLVETFSREIDLEARHVNERLDPDQFQLFQETE